MTKMTTMLGDLDSSKGDMDKFKKLNHRGRPNGVEMAVQILGNNAWDIDKSKVEKLELPLIFKKCIGDFSNFFTKDKNMYKLEFALGLVNIYFNFI